MIIAQHYIMIALIINAKSLGSEKDMRSTRAALLRAALLVATLPPVARGQALQDFFLSCVRRCGPLGAPPRRKHHEHAHHTARSTASVDTSPCVASCALQLLSWPTNSDAFEYFYAPAHPRNRFRLASCRESSRHPRGGTEYSGDLIWEAENSDAGPCLWSNMAFSKLLAVVMLARALKVTHIVESGRMGGLSLVHYHNLGFRNLTSIEMLPVPGVKKGLRQTIPPSAGPRLLDGDGRQLIPQAVADIRREHPTARIAVIIDGPKGADAVELSRRLLPMPAVAFVGLDDQTYTPDAGSANPAHALALRTNAAPWRTALPIARDGSLVDTFSRDFYHNEADVMTILLGADWLPRVPALTS